MKEKSSKADKYGSKYRKHVNFGQPSQWNFTVCKTSINQGCTGKSIKDARAGVLLKPNNACLPERITKFLECCSIFHSENTIFPLFTNSTHRLTSASFYETPKT